MFESLLALQTRSHTVYATAADFLSYHKFWCRVPAYTLKDDTPIESPPSNPTVNALMTWMACMGMDTSPIYQQRLAEENISLTIQDIPGNPQWFKYLDKDKSHFARSEGIFGPIWEPLEGPESFQKTFIPIAKMVELVCEKTDVILVDDFDAPAILYRVDNYLQSVQPRIYEKEIRDYVEKLLEFRALFYSEIFLKVVKKNPIIRDLYVKDYVSHKSIFSRTTGEESANVFNILRNPPITLPVIEEESERTCDEEQSFTTGYIQRDL